MTQTLFSSFLSFLSNPIKNNSIKRSYLNIFKHISVHNNALVQMENVLKDVAKMAMAGPLEVQNAQGIRM